VHRVASILKHGPARGTIFNPRKILIPITKAADRAIAIGILIAHRAARRV